MTDPSRKDRTQERTLRGGLGLSEDEVGRFQEELRLRWERGERILVEDYLAALPQPLDDPDDILDLIYHEVLVREELGESPQLDEYLRRFPQFTSPLHDQFRVHQALKFAGPVGQTSGHPTRGRHAS